MIILHSFSNFLFPFSRSETPHLRPETPPLRLEIAPLRLDIPPLRNLDLELNHTWDIPPLNIPDIPPLRLDIPPLPNINLESLFHDLTLFNYTPVRRGRQDFFRRQDMTETDDENETNFFNESFNYPQPTTPSQSSRPPAPGVNSDKLESIQAIREKRKQKKLDIPPEFYCQISGCVMTTPVHTEESPNAYFEKELLIYWLKQKPTHPHTRQPLTPEKLILDEALQLRINTFIAQHETKSAKRRISTREESELLKEAKSFLLLKTERQKKRSRFKR